MCDSKSDDGWNHLDFERDIEIGDRIGGGGVGIIYKGWLHDEPVALKTLFDPRVDDKLKKEYMDELLVMSKVSHSNIVSFLGACMTPPNLCFVMELCENSLHSLIHVDRVRYSEADYARFALDVASAMEYLHAQSPAIIHRDLKTLNVLIAFNGAAKICDFGLVKNPNIAAGTPAYMAPELFQNKTYNKAVDVYSFGVMLWEMLCEQIPFYMVEVADIRERVLSGSRPRIPASIPSRCARLIADCWEQDRDNRPDFGHVVDELIEISNSLPESKHTDDMDSKDTLDDLLHK